MIDLQKLKREWKTAALATAGALVETYDALVVTGQVDLPALFSDKYRPMVGPGILISMLLLRKWKDSVHITEEIILKTTTTDTKDVT